ncbi:MAG TPA: phosphoenolpyruvate carboxykinase domain-containing protein, partial [Planctomycetota bacterium]|nr:phosphoenolpyruvate carboxykinase domain-containing protein [Planctomycetota bacterium]
GKFLWPGFGENLRVLRWIVARCKGQGEAARTPIGYVPTPGGIDTSGLGVPDSAMEELLRVDPDGWAATWQEQSTFYDKLGSRLPRELRDQHDALKKRLGR